jgi:ketosteroid isomerase-like protein
MTPTTPSSEQHRTAESRSVLQAYLEALVTGDLAAIGASFADDAIWSVHGRLPLSGTRHGREEIMAFLVGAGSLYAPGTQRFSFGDITAEGERAVLEWRVQGIAAATGKSYDNVYCGVFLFRDGRIAEVREYLDSLHAADTLFATTEWRGCIQRPARPTTPPEETP